VRMQVQQAQLPSRVIFRLPADIQPVGLRIRMPGQQGDIEINGMDFGNYHWGPADIHGSFKMSADTGTVEVDDRDINIHAAGRNPYFSSVGSLEYVYGYLATRAAVIRAAVFLVSLLAFFAVIALLRKKGRIDQKAGLSILRLAVFYCVCILLLIPSVYTILNVSNLSKMPVFVTFEKKPDIPRFAWNKPADLLKNVYSYFSKSYAFRDLFIRWYCTLSVRLLDESPVPTVIAGKDGWLFVNMADSLDNHRGIKPLNQQELEDIKLKWTYIKNYLDSKGIYLLLVVAPDKESVYPEFLPARLGPFADNTRLDQVIAEIRTIPGLQYVDLRSTLISAKGQYPLYYKNDSHWNNLGVFIGYQEIARRLAPSFGAVYVPEIEEVVTKEYIHGGTDLPRMMIMSGEFPYSQVELTVQPQNAEKITIPSLLIFGDSFSRDMEPFLKDYFTTVVSAGVQQRFDSAIVERENPGAVIFVMVERSGGSNLLPEKLK